MPLASPSKQYRSCWQKRFKKTRTTPAELTQQSFEEIIDFVRTGTGVMETRIVYGSN
ncbi:MAG: hypothetical protein HOJ14_05990 [Nitrospina sp.]|nr:hypothetical protein [Nitrospina sp.]